jgi:hypothetical protein
MASVTRHSHSGTAAFYLPAIHVKKRFHLALPRSPVADRLRSVNQVFSTTIRAELLGGWVSGDYRRHPRHGARGVFSPWITTDALMTPRSIDVSAITFPF